jgi:hypothetical protein
VIPEVVLGRRGYLLDVGEGADIFRVEPDLLE